MASGDLGVELERLAELALRDRDWPWRGPTLGDRKDEVEDFRTSDGVDALEVLPMEGLRGDSLGFDAGEGEARELED